MNMHGRSLLTVTDLTAAEFSYLTDLAEQLRKEKHNRQRGSRLAGRNIALIFEKTSTRTRCAFEVAAHDEGAHVTYLGPGDSQLGRKESVKDTARVLGRMFDGIEYRGAAQQAVETLAAFSGVPVWNGLTDEWHPTQMLADVLTMRDHTAKPLSEVCVCYLGDGRNNTANSLLVTGALLGMDTRIVAPAVLQPAPAGQALARDLAAGSGARVTVTADLAAGVAGADFLYTDVWASMGQEDETARRRAVFNGFCVDGALVHQAAPEAVVLHCLPAHRGEEITGDVLDGPRSLAWVQAENRLHMGKAILEAVK